MWKYAQLTWQDEMHGVVLSSPRLQQAQVRHEGALQWLLQETAVHRQTICQHIVNQRMFHKVVLAVYHQTSCEQTDLS